MKASQNLEFVTRRGYEQDKRDKREAGETSYSYQKRSGYLDSEGNRQECPCGDYGKTAGDETRAETGMGTGTI